MEQLRILFTKTGRAKYISHLDMTRCMQRAFKRAALPIWYTEGFNPHMYLTFALPLSLGYESLCEYMDVKLVGEITPEEFVAKFNNVMPEGLEAVSAFTPTMKADKIKWSDYDITIYFDNASKETLEKAMADFTAQTEVVVDKKTKKGMTQIDIKPQFTIEDYNCEAGEISMKARFASGLQLNINPSLMMNALATGGNLQLSHWAVKRTAILTEDLTKFC